MNKETTAEYTAARGDAERLASLARLASGFAHDMNNILGAIEGYAVLAAGSLPADSQARRDMESVREAVRAAAELSGRMLLFARRRVMKPEACSPAELLAGAAAAARGAARPGIAVETAPPPGEPVLQADRARLALALEAMARNAVEAMPGGGTLTLGAETVRAGEIPGAGSDMLRFYVRDTGEGMGPEVLERVFEPYYSARKGGKGLGLALVYGVAAAHGGWAEARSCPGKGSEVSVFLPLG